MSSWGKKELLFSFAEKSWKSVSKTSTVLAKPSTVMLLSDKVNCDGLFYATWQRLWHFAGRLTPHWGHRYRSCCRLEGGRRRRRRRELRRKGREEAQPWITDALVLFRSGFVTAVDLFGTRASTSRHYRSYFYPFSPINAVNQNWVSEWERESKWRRPGPSPRPCSWSYWVLLWAWTRVLHHVSVQKLQTGLNFWTAVEKRCPRLLWESQHGSLMCKSQAELKAMVVYMFWRLVCCGASPS